MITLTHWSRAQTKSDVLHVPSLVPSLGTDPRKRMAAAAPAARLGRISNHVLIGASAAGPKFRGNLVMYRLPHDKKITGLPQI